MMRDFLSHSHSVIDFDKFDAALVLGTHDGNVDQSNGAGKSAIFEAVMWALFGKSRHKKSDGVVKHDCRRCKVEFTFDVDDASYKIIRKRDKVLGESDLILERFEDGEWINISSDTNTATGQNITKIINVNNSEVFVNSIYFKQNDISMFPQATPGKRKDILKSLLRMERWDAYQKRASNKATSLKTQIETKSQGAIDLEILELSIKECVDSAKSIKKKLTERNAQYSELSELIMEKKLKLQSLESANPESLKELQREYADVKKKIQSGKATLQENNATIQKNNEYTAKIQQKLTELNAAIKAGKGIDLEKMRKSILQGTTKVKVLKQQIEDKKQIEYHTGECYTCKKPLSQHDVSELEGKRDQEIQELKDQFSLFSGKLKRAQTKLSENEALVKLASEAEVNKGKANLKLQKLQNEIDNCMSENARIDEQLKKFSQRDYEQEIAQLKEAFDKDVYDKLKENIASAETEITNIKRSIDSLNVEYGSKVSKRNELKKQFKEQEDLQKEISKLKSEFVVYDKLKHYFGKDGIQAIIIENVIEELENYSNETLSKICNEPTSVSIKTQKQSESGSWTETFEIEVTSGGRTDEFLTFSGGEQFRVSLSLRLALSRILSKRIGGTLRFLLLDEVSSSLDDKGLEMFIGIVKKLSEDMKVLVITHDDKLKESFDDVLMVNKTQAGSTVALN